MKQPFPRLPCISPRWLSMFGDAKATAPKMASLQVSFLLDHPVGIRQHIEANPASSFRYRDSHGRKVTKECRCNKNAIDGFIASVLHRVQKMVLRIVSS